MNELISAITSSQKKMSLNSAPFGSSSNRFSINGLHPNLLTRGHIPHETTHIPDTVRNYIINMTIQT
jgi:hypothetical protein